MEETLEFQEEYPREVAEEVEEAEGEAAEEDFLPQHQDNKYLPMEETSLSATRHSYLPEIAQNQRRS